MVPCPSDNRNRPHGIIHMRGNPHVLVPVLELYQIPKLDDTKDNILILVQNFLYNWASSITPSNSNYLRGKHKVYFEDNIKQKSRTNYPDY